MAEPGGRAAVCTFVRESWRDNRTTGAVVPSGSALVDALVEPVRDSPNRPLTVLEVGAGTGSVTRGLLDVVPVGSRLDIVEINPRFATAVQQLVDRHPRSEELGAVRVLPVAVQDLQVGVAYDVIVSSLPLTNFDPVDVDALMQSYLAWLRPGGALTWFGYVGSQVARSLLASRAEVRRHRAVGDVLSDRLGGHDVERRTIWANLPPAHVWRLRGPVCELRPGPPDGVLHTA